MSKNFSQNIYCLYFFESRYLGFQERADADEVILFTNLNPMTVASFLLSSNTEKLLWEKMFQHLRWNRNHSEEILWIKPVSFWGAYGKVNRKNQAVIGGKTDQFPSFTIRIRQKSKLPIKCIFHISALF